MGSARNWLAAVVICAMSLAARPAAIERMRLPLFQLTAADGTMMTSDRLVRPGRWLMIYVQGDCRRCETLLRQVVKEQHPLVPPRLVVIVAPPGADAVRMAADFPDLAESSWFGDPAGTAIAPLQAGTPPVVFGLDGGIIEWSLTGVLAGSPEMMSVLASWIDKPAR
jgi:hypothetical protein